MFRFSRNGQVCAPEIVGATTEEQLRKSLGFPTEDSAAELPPEAGPTPIAEVARVLAILKPRADEVFVDYGCGADARWCVAAAETYGCRAVGVEIDPERAASARAHVASLGLSGRIEIIEGDALTADVDADVGVVYLYSDVLDSLRPKLTELDRFASYMHQVPNLPMSKSGDAYVWQQQFATQPVTADRYAVWGNQYYRAPVCNSPGCRMCASIRSQLR